MQNRNISGIRPGHWALITWSFMIVCILANCAREINPSGGVLDKTAPKMDSARSTPNFQTNFQKGDIVMVFDEWLQLNDAAKQVFVSPPLAKKPTVTLNGKKVVLKFDEKEELRANTTYTIHFGSAIQDLNERNTVNDLRYVFSTGPQIDSLSVRGKVVDALTGEPAKDVSVVLHINTADSALIKELPYYLARTNETGQYSIENVRADSYVIAAYKDENSNNKWDNPAEYVAFYDTLLNVQTTDTEAPLLAVFKTQIPLQKMDQDLKTYGLAQIFYSADASEMAVRAGSDSVRISTLHRTDTIKVWYDGNFTQDWPLYIEKDTIKVRPLNRADFLKNHLVRFAGSAVAPAKGKSKGPATAVIPPASPQSEQSVTASSEAFLAFQTPITAIDTAYWRMERIRDSTVVQSFAPTIDSKDSTRVLLKLPSVAAGYRLTLFPGAVTDFYSVMNRDTLKASFKYLTAEELGQLDLKLKALVPSSGYVLDLLANNAVVQTVRFVADSTEKALSFKALPPGTYSVKIIADANANGRWDSGDYFKRKQAELIYQQSLDPVRPNWTIEAEMILSAESKKKKK